MRSVGNVLEGSFGKNKNWARARKKQHDKRNAIRDREWNIEKQRAVRHRAR